MSGERPKPVLDQALYALNVGNAARYSPQELKPVRVVTIGRRWFEVSNPDGSRRGMIFALNDWRQKTDYTPDVRLYASPEEWEHEKEAHAIARELRTVHWESLGVQALRAIWGIVKPADRSGEGAG